MLTKLERDAAMAAANPPVARPQTADPADDMATLADGTVMTFAERRGFGQQTQKLAYPERPGYHRHWFNDEPGRLDDARRAGYVPVKGEDGLEVVRVADKTTGMKTHLHEVPLSWYKEDLKAAQRAADEKDSAIRRGDAPGEEGGLPGLDKTKTYGKVSMSRKPGG